MNKKRILLLISALAVFASLFVDNTSATIGQFTGNGVADRFIPSYNTTWTGYELCHITVESNDRSYTSYGTDSIGWYQNDSTNEFVSLWQTNTGFYIPAVINVNGSVINWQCTYPAIPWIQWETGETGATGATGWTGAQGMMWLSAYDLAVANWFSGSEVQWVLSLQGSWATIYYTNTGSSNIVINMPSETGGELDANSLYLPVAVQKDWTTYIDWAGIRNIVLLLWLLLFFALLIFKYIAPWKNSSI